jgi:hypothetical protein
VLHEIRPNKIVRPGLVYLAQQWGYDSSPRLDIEWVVEGTENMPHDPKRTGTRPEYGVWTEPKGYRDYGTIKRKGYEHVIVYRVASERVPAILGLDKGWQEIGRGSAYSYITQMVAKGSQG